MKTSALTFLLPVAILISASGCSSPSCGDQTANECAREIYYSLEQDKFDVDRKRKAIKKLQDAARINKNAEWVQLAYSRLLLNSAYKIGGLYQKDTYVDSVLEKSYNVASKVAKNSDLSQSYAHLARFQIIYGDYKKAWHNLYKAHQLDSDNFYSWYLKGVIYYFARNYKKGENLLVESKKYAEFEYQKHMVNSYRQNVARRLGDYSKEEKLLQKEIHDAPESAYSYAHYAAFLKRHERYKEAIKYFKKAVDIKPYGHAVNQLKELKQKVNG